MFNRIRERMALIVSWHSRPQAEQKRIAACVLGLSIIAPLFLWSWMNAETAKTMSDTEEIISRYERALPLTAQISAQSSNSDPGPQAVSALAAAQEAIRTADLDNRLTSLRPSRDLPGREGVQLYMENLNLTELLQLFSSLESQSGLRLVSCDLSRRQKGSRRMNARLILEK
ncbi:MAG: type II secretion system protein GspM [Desulfovermiculus sp.]|nr:type II secretion system protein GspM [Desulfovermiculus sp.]